MSKFSVNKLQLL